MLPDSVHAIIGHLSPLEAQLLYDLASAVPVGGTIVEIGSYQGRSTVCLGLGAKQVAGVEVFAIDPHNDLQVNENTHYGMENHAALLRNLLAFDVAETVRVLALGSESIVRGWDCSIDLLWIDGSHKESDVYFDLVSWEWHVSAEGKIAVHDSSGHFPDVTKALEIFMIDYPLWKVVKIVDATSILERAI